MSENQTTTSWGSRLGFILASAGSAVGLGAIWKFPYMAGTNGGSVFMLPYIFFTFTVGISLLVAEFAMGRAGREGPMASLTKVCGRGWGFFGGVGVFTVFLILSFYSGVGGWCIKYMVDAVIGRGLISDPELLGTHFGAFVSDGSMSFLYMMIFLGITSVVVLRGIQGGIERVAKVLMPALFILMLIIIVRGLTLPGGLAGLEYLFAPRWEDFNASALFNAMGFCFFSLSLGAGTMITYGSYLGKDENLPKNSVIIVISDTLVAIMAGLAVIPAAVANGIAKGMAVSEIKLNGPSLLFATLQDVFHDMGTIGGIFGLIFYALVLIAAISSAISLIEAVSVTFIDHASAKGHERDRNKVLAVVCLAITLLACLVTYKLRNIRFKGLALAASLPPVVFNAVIIGIEIAVMFPDPSSSAPLWLACVTNGISVGIGELISCTVLGVLLVRIIEASPAVRKVFES